MIDVIQEFDLPWRFAPALERLARTGRLVGAEFKSRVRTLSNFKAAVERLCPPSSPLVFTDAAPPEGTD